MEKVPQSEDQGTRLLNQKNAQEVELIRNDPESKPTLMTEVLRKLGPDTLHETRNLMNAFEESMFRLMLLDPDRSRYILDLFSSLDISMHDMARNNDPRAMAIFDAGIRKAIAEFHEYLKESSERKDTQLLE